MSKKYIAKGLVYGKYWGGGFGAYQARELKAKTKKSLLKEALKVEMRNLIRMIYCWKSLPKNRSNRARYWSKFIQSLVVWKRMVIKNEHTNQMG